MSKIPFNISAVKENVRAIIRITGEIGWDIDANDFRETVDTLVASGCTEAYLYINSPGGSCFDAAEIVNILTGAFGTNITGEGGALVASAATYISTCCKTFMMPQNGQFMVHQPRGGVWGRVSDIQSYLKLLEDIERNYFGVYEAMAKDKADFAKKWNAGDIWMTAQEAKDAGFITGVKESVKIDRETSAMIRACMDNNNYQLTNNYKEMDFTKTTALTLGLPADATEEQITAEIAKGKQAIADLTALKSEIAEKEAATKAEAINAALESAIANKRIKADARADWKEMLEANFEKGVKALEAIAPLTPLSNHLTNERKTPQGKVTHEGKTFEQLRDEDPDTLASLMANDPESYDALYQNYITRNHLN